MIIASTMIVIILSYIFSRQIKEYSGSLYLIFGCFSFIVILHRILIFNGYSVEYTPILDTIVKSIDSGALGGAIFIVVMYMGVFNMNNNFEKRLRRLRGELSIIGTIFTLPHNIHYLFEYIFNSQAILNMKTSTKIICLIMFMAGLIAIIIMIPLFITSFIKVKRRIPGKTWKYIQNFAYIFYAAVFVQVAMVYIGKPSSLARNLSILFYMVIFISYTYKKFILNSSKKLIRQGV